MMLDWSSHIEQPDDIFDCNSEKFNQEEPGYVLDTFVYVENNPSSLTDSDYFDLDHLLESVGAMVRSNPSGFEVSIVERLDFVNPATFAKTGILLSLLEDLVYEIENVESESDYYDANANIVGDFSASEAVLESLQKAVVNKQGSYLLYSRAKKLLTGLTEPSDKAELSNMKNEEFDRTQVISDTEIRLDKISLSPEDIRDFTFMRSHEMRSHIEAVFEVTLDALTSKEQFYFLNYLKRVPVPSAEVMQSFTRFHGVDGMRTFLSLEKGDESLGDKIVVFGQHEDVAQHVFKYYGELLDSADNAEKLVKELKQGDDDISESARLVRNNILHRAQKDLIQAVQSDDVESIRAKLDTYSAGAKEYVALLQEVGEGQIEQIRGGDLTNDDKTQMRTLVRSNYASAYPDKKDDEFRRAVASSLEEHLDDPSTTFRILYDGAKIVSFNRFDTLTDTSSGRTVSYFGSFNAATSYSGVGGVMLERTIEEQLTSGDSMFAHCDPTQRISMKYIEDGFVAVAIYDLAGKESFEIWRSDESSEEIKSKQMSTEELVTFSKENEEGIVVRQQLSDDSYPELKQGKALTRFFEYEEQKYVVFERLSNELQKEFTQVQEHSHVIAAE